MINATLRRGVLHPYSDALPQDSSVRTYSAAELLAEKTGALYERTRPRDLYDVAPFFFQLDLELTPPFRS